MRTEIVIRSRQREAYLDQYGDWTPHMVYARHFPSAAQAEALCLEEKLSGVEILVLRPDRPPMRIPVHPRHLSPPNYLPPERPPRSSARENDPSP